MPDKKVTSLIALLVSLAAFLGAMYGFEQDSITQISSEITGVVTGLFVLFEIIRMNLKRKRVSADAPTGTQRPPTP